MLFAIVREPGQAPGAGASFAFAPGDFPAKYRIVAEFASRGDTPAVTILEAATPSPYLSEIFEEGCRIRTFPVGTAKEGLTLARLTIEQGMPSASGSE
jgi:hypothetical protein